MPREFILLQGTGCAWKRCTFCDYFLDVTKDPFLVNRPIIERLRGVTGVVDVINSGSAMELDDRTLEFLQEKIAELPVHTLWVEAHWMYRNKLGSFAEKFPGVTVKFRTGVETFDGELRSRWKKGIPSSVTPNQIAQYFSGACLLIGVQGQTRESIARDIKIALEYFEYFSVNAFVENSTDTRRDEALISWFEKEILPGIKDNPKVEVLLHNTDLGVG